MNVLVLLVGKRKKQQTDPEDNKEKQHKLRMNIRNVYISIWSTIHSLG